MATQDSESVESFEMDIVSEESEDDEDDEEAELFVKNGKKKKSYENGALKKPLIKGSKRNGGRKRGVHTEIRTGSPAARRCCGPVCCVLIGVKTVLGLAALTIVLTNYFTHSDWLFWHLGLGRGPGAEEILGCEELEVRPVWQTRLPKLLTEGSVRMLHVNEDGVADLVLGFGTGADGYNIPAFVCDIYFAGQQPCLGGVLALDGRDGRELWRLWTEHEIFSLTCQADLDGDNVTDCLAGGRAGVFLAVSARTGAKIWDFGDHAVKSDLMSVYAAQLVPDLDGDGVQDVLAVHGGDPLSDPAHRNMYGRIILFSGRDGRLLRWVATPDRRESYYPPQLLTGADGARVVLYGTGGNMNSGALYAIALLDLYRKNLNSTRLVYRDTAKGILSPALLVDVTGDGLEDIVIATINSNVMAFDGATFRCLWNRTLAGYESITALAAAQWDEDAAPDVMVKFNYGSVFPVYQYQQSLVLSGANGSTLASLAPDTLATLSSPLALSLTGAGNDMFLHWRANCEGAAPGTHIYYDFRAGTHVHEQSRADLCRALLAAPTVSRLVAVSARLAAAGREQEIYNSTHWARREHEGAVNTSAAADRYLAQHPEIQQQMEAEAEAGAAAEQYSVLPYKNKNFGSALQLLEEEMAREYGDGQPFIDPGSQAYEAFDYQEPQDNGSSEGGLELGQYPQYPVQYSTGARRRRAAPAAAAGSTARLRPGLSRQTGTGSLAPSLIPASDSLDLVFPVHWIYPPRVDVLQQQDLDCIAAKLTRRRAEAGVLEGDSEQLAALQTEVEEECLKVSGHFAREAADTVYETPSEYDPLSINMGQLVVYRFQLRCKCGQLRGGQQCATFLPLERQGWPAYMGGHGDSLYRRGDTRR